MNTYHTFVSDAPPPYIYNDIIPITNKQQFDKKYMKLNLLKAFDVSILIFSRYANRLLFTDDIKTSLSYDELRDKICKNINQIVINYSNNQLKYLKSMGHFYENTRDKIVIIISDRKIKNDEKVFIEKISHSQYTNVIILPININICIKNTLSFRDPCKILDIPSEKNIEEMLKDGLMKICYEKEYHYFYTGINFYICFVQQYQKSG